MDSAIFRRSSRASYGHRKGGAFQNFIDSITSSLSKPKNAANTMNTSQNKVTTQPATMGGRRRSKRSKSSKRSKRSKSATRRAHRK
jgi:hypothetical protein